MVAIKKRHRRKQAALSKFCVAFVGTLLLFVAWVFVFSSPDDRAPAAAQFESFAQQLGASKVKRSKPEQPKNPKGGEKLRQQQQQQRVDGGNDKDVKSTQGSHVIDNAYVAEYQYERENPQFRQQMIPAWTLENASKFGSVQSCRYLGDDGKTLLWNSEKCNDSTQVLIAYNNAPFERFWCGETIAPKTAVEIKKGSCVHGPVTLVSPTGEEVPLNGAGMPPIVVRGSPNSNAATEEIECTVPCQFETKFHSYERYIEKTPWKIHFTMDDPVKNSHAKVEPTAFRNDLYFATTSFKSSVPRTYFKFGEYDIFAPPVEYDKVKKSGSYVIDSQCNSHFTKRNRWAEAVKNQFETHFYGSCDHTTDAKGKDIRKKGDRMKLMSEHLFTLAFEFGDAKDHITPVVWEAMSSGTLPVIVGAGNMGAHLPANSFVSKDGLQHWDDLGKLVAKVVGNKTAWESFHKYRTDPKARQKFETMYSFSRTPDTCRLCKWAYAKKYGMGWSHKHQEIQPTHVARMLMLDSDKLVVKPFSEEWIYSGGESIIKDSKSEGQRATTSERSIDKLLDRSIQFHDNIFDITFQNFASSDPRNDIIMRLKLPVENFDGSFFYHPHAVIETSRGAAASSIAIQDQYSKVIVVSNWQTEIISSGEGVIDVVVRQKGESLSYGTSERRQIRVIIEDMVELHDKTTEFYPTTFAKQMVQDFIDPLELYYLEH